MLGHRCRSWRFSPASGLGSSRSGATRQRELPHAFSGRALCRAMSRSTRADWKESMTMADRRTHKVVGGASGAIAAAYMARDSEPIQILMEALGGAIGGVLGGLLPDEFEPAIHSWHRSIAHSLTGVAAGVVTLPTLIGELQEYC